MNKIKGQSSFSWKSLWGDLAYDVAGCFIFSVSVQCFSSPNNIAAGGVSGISILVNYLTGFPISLTTLLLNIPLLILALLFLGKGFALRTVKTVLILTVMLEISGALLPPYHGQILLAALSGGVLEGVGLSLIFMRGSSTGGTTIASHLFKLRFPHIPVGKLMLMVDGAIIAAAVLVYRNLENGLVALIHIYCSTRIIDTILYGLDRGKVMVIVTGQYRSVSQAIMNTLDRGCTLLQGKGTYTGEERPALFCAVRRNQLYTLKQLVHDIDPDAFMVALEASEILGEGFRRTNQQDNAH